MKCPKCGKRIDDAPTVCIYCGEHVTTYANNKVDSRRQKQPSGMWGTFLFVISLVLMILSFLINAGGVLTLGGVVAFFIGVVLCAISRYLKYRNTSKYRTDKLAKSITKRLTHENNATVRLIAKKVPIARTVLTICFAILLFFTLDALYYQYFVIPVLAILFLVYETIFLKFNTFSVLYKKAKKNPDLTAADIVMEETYNEVDSPQVVKTGLICIAAVIISIGSFIYLNLESSLSVEDVDGGVSVAKYEPGLLHLREAVVIPEAIDGKQVVAISEDAFAWNIYIKEIDIPNTVKTIGESAFCGCSSLSYVFIPDSVTDIGKEAFSFCNSLYEIYVPQGASIHKKAFDKESTNVIEKPWNDETTDKINEEFDNLTIEKIYVIYDKEQGKDVIYSPENNGSITISHTDRLSEKLADNMDLLVIETPAEFLEYLKKARDAGIVNVLLGFDSKVAAEAIGEPRFISYSFDIEVLIQSYEEDLSEF